MKKIVCPTTEKYCLTLSVLEIATPAELIHEDPSKQEMFDEIRAREERCAISDVQGFCTEEQCAVEALGAAVALKKVTAERANDIINR